MPSTSSLFSFSLYLIFNLIFFLQQEIYSSNFLTAKVKSRCIPTTELINLFFQKMSIKTIKVQKVPDGKLVRIGIENDNGINISTLERLFPNIQLLGYFNQDGELFS